MKIEEANEVVKFAEDVLHIELLPWQKYFISHCAGIGVTRARREARGRSSKRRRRRTRQVQGGKK